MKKTFFCIPVKKSEVVNTAIKVINQAQHEVVVTHSTQDTSKVKPTREYFESLSQLNNKGIKVKRYIFGSRNFKQIDNYGVEQFYAGDDKAYQRAIIVDQRIAMFKLGDSFFTSTYKPLVNSLYKFIVR